MTESVESVYILHFSVTGSQPQPKEKTSGAREHLPHHPNPTTCPASEQRSGSTSDA